MELRLNALRHSRKLSVAAGLLAYTLMPSAKSYQPLKISEDLTQLMAAENADTKFPILVYMTNEADLSGAYGLNDKVEKGRYVYSALTTAAGQQDSLVEELKAGGFDYQRFHIVNMVAVYNANQDLVTKLTARDDIRKVYLNSQFKTEEPADLTAEERRTISSSRFVALGEEDAAQPNIKSTGAEKIWTNYNTRGAGIVIAGQDTGVAWQHEALKNQYRGFDAVANSADHSLSWHDSIRRDLDGNGRNPCGLDSVEPCDDHAHGTHSLGSAVGGTPANQIGMAPDAKWIACRNMEEGLGRATTYMECFEWFLAPYVRGGNALTDGKPEMAPHVINNSWGCPGDEGCSGDEFVGAVKAMHAAGIMTVVSAGNDGSSCSTIMAQPAMLLEWVLAVGAHNHGTGTIAGFSSRGPVQGSVGPHLTAPGVNIRSAVPTGGYEQMFWSGTSMAGPHVAGAAALLWSHFPSLVGNVAKTFEILKLSSTGKTTTENCGNVAGTARPNNTYGHGHLNVEKAFEMAASTM